MFANRVRKNFRKLHPRFEQRRIGAFRIYDRDIPEIRAAIDWYEGHLVVAEYAREQTAGIPWLETMARAAADALEVPWKRVHLRKRRTGEKYERLAGKGERIEVREGNLKFLVNLDDYIDTGLFADHRETRALVRRGASAKRFLNLFAYTGTFTCSAAKGGALQTTTVDASQTYLDWARDNLRLNGVAEGELVAAYVRMTGTHTAPFGAIAATGKTLTLTGAYHCRVVDSKLVEDWDSWTVLPLFQQTVAVLQA